MLTEASRASRRSSSARSNSPRCRFSSNGLATPASRCALVASYDFPNKAWFSSAIVSRSWAATAA